VRNGFAWKLGYSIYVDRVVKKLGSIYSSIVQPIRHSTHVANGRLNVANGSVPKNIL